MDKDLPPKNEVKLFNIIKWFHVMQEFTHD